MRRRPRSSTLFPYTTLFRSEEMPSVVSLDPMPPVALDLEAHAAVRSLLDAAAEQAMEQPSAESVAPETDVVASEVELIAEARTRSEEHTSELQSRENLVCRL